ncbi:hypothetical protein [Treponema sp.]|nr:hypothetical protein [Treponema sp.]MCR5612798.1 hypothetical protein [Treponema sp.]
MLPIVAGELVRDDRREPKEALGFYKAAVWPDVQTLGISEEVFLKL